MKKKIVLALFLGGSLFASVGCDNDRSNNGIKDRDRGIDLDRDRDLNKDRNMDLNDHNLNTRDNSTGRTGTTDGTTSSIGTNPTNSTGSTGKRMDNASTSKISRPDSSLYNKTTNHSTTK
jgi:hypothetical protein